MESPAMSYYDIGAIVAGFVIQSVIALAGYLKSRDNGQKTDVLVATVTKNTDDLTSLAVHTNGMKDALLKITAESEHAKGVLQGKADKGS
jgi:hypothetical protein